MDETTDRPPCPHCRKARRKAFEPRMRGTFQRADGSAAQRFQCGNPRCGRTFSEHLEPTADRGRRTDIDPMLFSLACSGVTIRRSAILLGVAINTVRRRMAALAERARAAHAEAAQDPRRKTSTVQFDEMETFLRNKAFPLSIALAVRRGTGEILSAKVATMSAKGRLAAKGRAMGWVEMNDAATARKEALTEAARFLRAGKIPTFVCDGARSYPREIASHVGRRVRVESKRRDPEEPHDPLFRLNHVCAKIRADVACMARSTWTTTKRVECLQDRLDIYIAWNNGYAIL